MNPNSFEENPENGLRRSTRHRTLNGHSSRIPDTLNGRTGSWYLDTQTGEWQCNRTLADLNNGTGSWYLDTQTGQWLSAAPQGARPSQASTARQPAGTMASVPSDSYNSTNHSNANSAESTSGTNANAYTSSGYIPPTKGAESSPRPYVSPYSTNYIPAPSSGTISAGNASSQRRLGRGPNWWFNTVMDAPTGSPPSHPQPESHGNRNEVELPAVATEDASASSATRPRRSTRERRLSRRAVESQQSSQQKFRRTRNYRVSKRDRK